MNKTKPVSLTKFAWLSIFAAISTMLLKTFAYQLTGSVGLLSDAMESIVNLLGALMALWMLKVASLPADEHHSYGHTKAEYFSTILEGFLILIAAISIAYTAIERLIHDQNLEKVSLGLVVSTGASIINLIVALILKRAGKKYNSITLIADSKHLMTDVWTSVGVILGIIVVSVTGLNKLDPIIALLVAINIVWTGINLIHHSIDGLMDRSIPSHELILIESIMNKYRDKGVDFHALRTRIAASKRFLTLHMLVPGKWSVSEAHTMAEAFEGEIKSILGDILISTHIEPIEEEVSFSDVHDQ